MIADLCKLVTWWLNSLDVTYTIAPPVEQDVYPTFARVSSLSQDRCDSHSGLKVVLEQLRVERSPVFRKYSSWCVVEPKEAEFPAIQNKGSVRRGCGIRLLLCYWSSRFDRVNQRTAIGSARHKFTRNWKCYKVHTHCEWEGGKLREHAHFIPECGKRKASLQRHIRTHWEGKM